MVMKVRTFRKQSRRRQKCSRHSARRNKSRKQRGGVNQQDIDRLNLYNVYRDIIKDDQSHARNVNQVYTNSMNFLLDKHDELTPKELEILLYMCWSNVLRQSIVNSKHFPALLLFDKSNLTVEMPYDTKTELLKRLPSRMPPPIPTSRSPSSTMTDDNNNASQRSTSTGSEY